MASPTLAKVFAFGVVILAAGRSSRMGRSKLLLPWGQTTVLGHLLFQWHHLGPRQLAVVCAANDQVLQAELDRLGFPATERIYNPAPDRGMFSSIQTASQWPGWRGELTHWAITLGDQPHLRPETLSRAIEFAAAHPDKVCQPARSGHGRHPVFFPRTTFLPLAHSQAAHLKEFLAALAEPVALWESEDAGLDLDLDHPEDYQALLKLAPRAGEAR